ncbi:MAG TPA: zf-HC2 domain-containing protein [Ktedonobacterales bacterium]
MSNELRPGDGSTSATLACASGVTPDRLSALRDGLLPTQQAQELRSHIAGCAACQERMRDYESIGAALRGQIIPVSNTDPWPAMRQAIQRDRQQRRILSLRLPPAPSWGRVSAVIAATLLVALFAGLLARQARLRSDGTTTTSATATSAAPAGTWTRVAAYAGVSGLRVAPSDPRVAYQFWLRQTKGSPDTLVLRRTEDQGATWHTLTPPTMPGAAYPVAGGPVTGFVSPLDPRVVYLIIAVQTTPACNLNGATSSGYCQLEFVSVNSGDSWQSLSLPALGLISSLLVGNGYPQNQIAGDIQAQGSRLYADIVSSQIGADSAPSPGRLAASDDGGVTWRLIDDQIFAAGQGIYNYAVSTRGSTIYVASETFNQPPMPINSTPQLTFWGSDDAGATWTELGPSPNSALISMRAATVASSGKPILYIQTADDTGRQYIQGSLYGYNGGFLAAPDPGNGKGAQGTSLLMTLPDGSIVIVYQGSVEEWMLSPARTNVDWRSLADTDGLSSTTAAFTETLPGGATRLWLVGQDDQGVVVEYTTLRM